MPPAALLAIIAVGLVLAYVMPQRIRERSDYALVRTEDRYSAEMRVVRARAARVERQTPSTSGEVPLLVTGAARAKVAEVAGGHMSRPASPLERAAVRAQRESIHLRRDRMGSMEQRAIRARRRALVVAVAATLAAALWTIAALTAMPVVVAGVATGLFAASIGFSMRAAAAERSALAQVRAVVREVETAATATRALKAVAAARAQGLAAEPSDVATRAIRIVTAEYLAPLAAPGLRRPSADRAQRAADAGRLRERAQQAVEAADAAEDSAAGWRPRTMPVPAYALKPSVRQQVARQLREEDYAASSHAAARAAGDASRNERQATESPTQTGALDAILARRKAASA